MKTAEYPQYPHCKNREFGVDVTQIDMRKKIGPATWEAVVRSAEILQEDNDVPFEKGDVVFHPGSGRLFEVGEVFDNRHRMALRNITLECFNGTEVSYLQAGTVLHLGYLVDAHTPYNPQVAYITGENMEEIGQNLLSILDS